MSLRQRIEDDLLQAIKEKNELSRDVLRGLKSSMKNLEIELKKDKISDEDIEKTIVKEVKKRKESIDAFTSAGKLELAADEQKELELLNKYLPEQMSEEEVMKIVSDILAAQGESANTGSVMKEASAKLRGRADMGIVSKIVAIELDK